MRSKGCLRACSVIGIVLFCVSTAGARPLGAWPEIFDPLTVPDLNLKIRSDDFEKLVGAPERGAVPALFWASQDGGEARAVLVSIERVSRRPADSGAGFEVDVNAFVGEDARAKTRWHGLRSVLLVAGTAKEVLGRGFAVQLHRLAKDAGVYPEGYEPPMANWADVSLHLAPACGEACDSPFEFGETLEVRKLGLHVNAETIDTQFFRNRSLWDGERSWIYRQRSAGEFAVKRPGCAPAMPRSPAVELLRCSPFELEPGIRSCDPAEIRKWVDTKALLGMAAVDEFSANEKGLFHEARGFYWLDSSAGRTGDACKTLGRRRLYFPEVADSSFDDLDLDVYAPGEGVAANAGAAYASAILRGEGEGRFRSRFNRELLILSDTPFLESATEWLDSIEKILSPHFANGPNRETGKGATDLFGNLATWLRARSERVRAQVCRADETTCGAEIVAHPEPAPTIDTHLYPLRMVAVGLEEFRARGGAIEPVGEDLLFVTPRGRLGRVARSNAVAYLDARVPMNEEGLLSAPIVKDSKFLPKRFRVADLLVRPASPGTYDLFVSHHHFSRDCIDFRISASKLRTDGPQPEWVGPWRTVFVAKPCIPTDARFTKFYGHESGGRMLFDGDDRLLIVIGDHGMSGRVEGESKAAMDPDSDFGKLLRVHLKSGRTKVVATGLRNPQGFVRDADGDLWETEHGPQGGDELNRMQSGENYGWPEVTYGVDYGFEAWPYNTVQGEHEGFAKPAFAWVPSIAISNLIVSESVLFPGWRGDLLIASLKGSSLFRARLNGDRVAYVERIPFGTRLRDVAQLSDGSIALLTDDSRILFVDRDPSYCDYAAFDHVYRVGCEDLVDYRPRPSHGTVTSRDLPGEYSGATLFDRKCGDCHNLYEEDEQGPHLVGILGRRAGARPGYGFSKSLRSSNVVWTHTELVRFMRNPQALGDGVRMRPVELSPEEAASIADFLAAQETP